MEHRYIGVFGMMGSGKSVLINEFLHQRPEVRKIKFTPPPVEAKFRGMDFEFVDQIFALKKDSMFFNFYELDAPTINKWTQFISIADSIIIAYNYTKNDYFESPEKFIQNVMEYSDKSVPLFFVVNKCDYLSDAKNKLEEVFKLSRFPDRIIDIQVIPEASVEFTKNHGRRVSINIELLDKLYSSVVQYLLEEN